MNVIDASDIITTYYTRRVSDQVIDQLDEICDYLEDMIAAEILVEIDKELYIRI